MNEQQPIATIILQVIALTIIVFLIDAPSVRAALATIPVVLLAQRAIRPVPVVEIVKWSSGNDLQMGKHLRDHSANLLGHFKDFYALCHFVGVGEIDSETALLKANKLEKRLTALLEELDRGPQEETGVEMVEREQPAEAAPA